MKKPTLPANEVQRLQALRGYELLDTPPEPAFDGLTALAAHVAGAPMALASLVDADRQWIKSGHGFSLPQIPRDVSFCGHVVAGDAPLIVPDASLDERFADNPLVTGDPYIRFYAGFPLRSPDGLALGTLCAMDRRPRELAPGQRELLETLARQAADQLELRRQAVVMSAQRAQLEVRNGFFDLTLELLCTANDKLYFIELNPAWEQTLGWTLEELRSRPFTEFVHPDDLEQTIAEADQLLLGRLSVNFENRYRHKSGRWVPLSWVSAVKGSLIYAAAKDMTAYHRKAFALAESEARLRATIDMAADAILTYDARGVIEQANSSASEIFGHSPDELIGRSVEILVPPTDREQIVGTFASTRRGGMRLARGREFSALRKDGSVFPVEVAISEIRLPDRSLYTAIIRDLSERKQLERMQAEFVSMVSHELRTPLTSIHGSLGLVAAGVTGTLPEEAKQYVNIAISNSDRLVRLINDILDIEKMRSGGLEFRLTTVDLGKAVKDAIAANEAFVSSHRARLALVSDLPPGEVLVDPDRLAQVLTNLISNAAKFSPPGGVVELSMQRVDDRFRVNVRDHGPGLPDDFRARVFQRFAQADASSTRQKGGTGLGLSISKALVEKMRGSIGFEPAKGGGTTFYFELPYLPPVVGAEPPPPGADLVLVCEDEPDVAGTIDRALRTAGFATHLTPTLERARRLLGAHRYAAITLDLALADGDGATLISEIRSSSATRTTPIIVVSGSSGHLGQSAVLVSDIILKPFEEKRLIAAVENAVARCRNTHPRVLHVEDEEDIRRVIQRTLPSSWTVVGAGTVGAGRKALAESEFDLLVLDLSLPDGQGDELISLAGRAQVIIFSAFEVSAELSRRVSAALVKSRASSRDVCDTIVSLIAHCRETTGGA
jgi:PAS domain S-box-containing protein